MAKELKRRGISGIYIFDKFPEDEKRKPTCFEDCSEEKQDEWLDSLDIEALKRLAKSLGNTLVTLVDQFGIVKEEREEGE